MTLRTKNFIIDVVFTILTVAWLILWAADWDK